VDNEERLVDIDHSKLTPEALRGLIEELITREGTDYGLTEASLDEKIADVERRLADGDAKIVFDSVEEFANIVTTR
jgi:uncharacterized protein YheU (UPF0270 family)